MVIEVIDLFVEPGRDSLVLSRNYVGTGEEKTMYVTSPNLRNIA